MTTIPAQPEHQCAFKAALLEWAEKSEWARQDLQPHELGMHLADVIQLRFSDLEAKLQAVTEEGEGYKRSWLAECQSNNLKAITIGVAVDHLVSCREKLAGIAPPNYIEALDGFISAHRKNKS